MCHHPLFPFRHSERCVELRPAFHAPRSVAVSGAETAPPAPPLFWSASWSMSAIVLCDCPSSWPILKYFSSMTRSLFFATCLPSLVLCKSTSMKPPFTPFSDATWSPTEAQIRQQQRLEGRLFRKLLYDSAPIEEIAKVGSRSILRSYPLAPGKLVTKSVS